MGISAHNAAVGTVVHSAELANRIQAGDPAAESEFAETFSHRLLLILLRNTRDPEVARDCCQKTLLIALTKMRAGEILKPKSLMAFLKCTAANVVITHFRSEKRYTHLGDRVFMIRTSPDDSAPYHRDCETLRQMLMETLDRLSVPRDREILRRFYLGEEEKRDICMDFDIKPEHFDRVLYRAKNRVRQILNSNGDLRVTLEDCLAEAGEALWDD